MSSWARSIFSIAITIAVLLSGDSSASADDEWYTVQAGDSVASIAAHFQVPEQALIDHNNLSDDGRISRGQVLRIPRPQFRQLSYKVGADDSLRSIAARYGLAVEDLMAANKIQRESHVIPGQTIYLPAGALDGFEGSHVVQPGEALNRIAERYGLEWRTLATVNNLVNPNLIYAGQALRVPLETAQRADLSKPEPVVTIPASTTVPTVVPAPAQSLSTNIYRIRIVQPGDTIESLAQRYAAPLQDLYDLNSLRGESRLYAGEIIVLPLASGLSGQETTEAPANGISHVVRRGESLGSIADLYGRNMWDIAAANGLLNPNLIYVGQVLIIR